MARGDALGHNMLLIEQNALRRAKGDYAAALRIVSEAAAYFYGCKSAGADREGAKVRNWNPKEPPDALLIPGER